MLEQNGGDVLYISHNAADFKTRENGVELTTGSVTPRVVYTQGRNVWIQFTSGDDVVDDATETGFVIHVSLQKVYGKCYTVM